MVCVEGRRAVAEVRNIDIRCDETEPRTPFSSTSAREVIRTGPLAPSSSASEATMSVSDAAVSMAATWRHPCTPAGVNWVGFANEHTSTRITESDLSRH